MSATHTTQGNPRITQWNPQIDEELEEARRQHARRAADRRDNGIPLSEYMRVVCASVAPVPSAVAPNIKYRALRNGVLAACLAAVPVLVDIFIRGGGAEGVSNRLAVAAKTIAVSFAGGAGVTWLTETLLQRLKQQLLSAQFLRTLAGSSTPVAAEALSGMCGPLALLLFKAMWDGSASWVSSAMGDVESANIHWESFKSNFSVDALLPAAAVMGVTAFLGPAAGSALLVVQAGYWALLGVTSTVTDRVIHAKNAAGGWADWAYSLVFTDRRAREWTGVQFNLIENQLTDTLRCCISGRMPIKPVRSTRNGQLYERSEIYNWLDHNSIDPFDRQPASRLDYVSCAVTTKWIYRIVNEFNANEATI